MKQFLVRRIANQNIEYAVKLDDTDPAFVGPSSPDYPAATIFPSWQEGFELIAYEGDTLLSNRPTATAELRWDGAAPAWVETADLDTQRVCAVDAMSQACGNAITAGFVSSALGAAYSYPAKPTDQANLSGSVLASILPGAGAEWVTPFWCADAAGAWEFRAHTAAQIQQVGVDAKAAILGCMNKNAALAAQIMAADADQLKTIVWPA